MAIHSGGYGKFKTAAWLFQTPWQTSLLVDKIKPFLVSGLICNNRKWLKCVLYNLYGLGHPLCWTGHIDIGKKLHKCLGDYHFYWHPQSLARRAEQRDQLHGTLYKSLQPHGLYSPWNSPSQNTGVGSFSLLQGIFPTQGLNPGLLNCRWVLYQLSHEGNPRI